MGQIYFSYVTVVEFDEFDVQAHCTFPFDRVDNITTVKNVNMWEKYILIT